jgi:dolichol-phosphate mannosyltransferase
MKLSVVIAAYDEVANVEPLVRRLASALATLAGCSWELVFVVEGEDGTRQALQRLAGEIAGIRILYQRRPAGLGDAFRRGFAAVRPGTDYVVTMDADLNHQPEEIPRLLAAARRLGCDVLIGSRHVAGGVTAGIPLWKRLLSGAFNQLFSRPFGLRVRDKTSGFRVYRAAVLRNVRHDSDDFAFLPELLIRAGAKGYSLAEAPITFLYRQAGRSKMSLWRTSLSYLALLRGSPGRFAWCTLLLVALGVAWRVALEFPVHRYPADGDCSLTGIAALRLLHGHPPVFFGSPRLGALGTYFDAPFLLLFGVSRTTQALGPLLVDLLQLAAWTLLLRELLTPRLAVAALPFAALLPPAIAYWTYMPNGYPEMLLFCTSTLWLAARLAHGDPRRLTVFALGLSLGLGWWSSAQTLIAGLPALVWLAWSRPRLLRDRSFLGLTVLGCLLGALPWLAWNAGHHLLSLRANYAVRPAASVRMALSNAGYVLTDQLPELVAASRGSAASNAIYRLLRWPALLISAAAALLSLLSTPHRAGPGADRGKDPGPRAERRAEREACLLFVLVLLATLALNAVSAAGAERGPVSTVRFVLPVYLLAPALLAIALTRIGSRSRAVAGILAAVVLAANAAGTYQPWTPDRQAWARDGAAFGRVLDALSERRVSAVFGSYWAVYPLNFLSREAILGIPIEAGSDFWSEAERLPARPVRWALLDYKSKPGYLAEVARRARLDGEIRKIGSFALLLPRDNPPPGEAPEQVRRRLTLAW